MAVIKNTQSRRLLKDAVVLDLGDLSRQAVEIIRQARNRAKVVISEAEETARGIVEESSGKGYKDGFEKGKAEGHLEGAKQAHEEVTSQFTDELQALQQSWQAALEDWETKKSDMLLQSRRDVLHFAFSLARKIVHQTIQHDPRVIASQLDDALMLLSHPSSLRIALNPQDAPLVRELLPELCASIASCKHVDILEQDSMTRGGCVLTTPGGEIDATIETQLQRMAEALLEPGGVRNADEDGDPES